jgi:hypothetical protein
MKGCGPSLFGRFEGECFPILIQRKHFPIIGADETDEFSEVWVRLRV